MGKRAKGIRGIKKIMDRDMIHFARPITGKIAVKVINHYGDEVMKGFAV